MTHAKWANVRWPSRDLAVFDRKGDEQVKITLQRFHDAVHVSIWKFYRKTPDGEWRPTKQGLTFRRSEFAELIAAFQRAENESDDLAKEAPADKAA